MVHKHVPCCALFCSSIVVHFTLCCHVTLGYKMAHHCADSLFPFSHDELQHIFYHHLFHASPLLFAMSGPFECESTPHVCLCIGVKV
ncbi:hypothetical protein CPB85DRAFT_1342608, partial [Mucidula mucida]